MIKFPSIPVLKALTCVKTNNSNIHCQGFILFSHGGIIKWINKEYILF